MTLALPTQKARDLEAARSMTASTLETHIAYRMDIFLEMVHRAEAMLELDSNGYLELSQERVVQLLTDIAAEGSLLRALMEDHKARSQYSMDGGLKELIEGA